MKLLYLLIPLLLAQIVRAQAPADPMHLGLRFDDDAYLQVERKPDNIVYKAPLPRAISYEKYLPAVEQQGEYGTCVAFSCGYYARTATEAIRRGLTNRAQINQTRFSPAYLYARFSTPGDNNCQRGGSLSDGLAALKTNGVPLWSALPYPQCARNVNALDREAARYRIRHYERIVDVDATTDPLRRTDEAGVLAKANVLNVKRALAGGYPVPIGMLVPLSFLSISGDTWVPGPNDVADLADEIKSKYRRQRLFGHALTVVGYDDDRQAFRVVNSWGTRWADKGLCWIKYSDFGLFTRYAFRIYPAEAAPGKPVAQPKATGVASRTNKPALLPPSLPRPLPTAVKAQPQPDEPVTMQARVELRLMDGSAMPARRLPDPGRRTDEAGSGDMGAYRLVNAYPSGTRFKLTVNNDRSSFVYVIGTDQSMKLTRLFPYADSLSAMVDADESAVLPGPTKHIRLDANPGQEHYVVLFSDEPLDLGALITEMSALSGSLSQRVTQTLGDRLMDWQTMQYNPDLIQFSTRTDATGKVVPVLITLEHKL